MTEFKVQVESPSHAWEMVNVLEQCKGDRMVREVHVFIAIDRSQDLPYSRQIWRRIKFGGLAVYMYMYMYITIAKLKSANILAIVILAKFNSCQYFRLYGIFFMS